MPQVNNICIFTGAGFTKNFGGFLATEMWAQIFNDRRTQSQPKLRASLQENYDFESVYSEILDGEHFSVDEKHIISDVVHDAYKRLDDAIRGWVFNDSSPHPVNIYGLGKLQTTIHSAAKGGPTYFFTLNQDIFVERNWGHPSPGAPRFSQDFLAIRGREFNQNEFVTLPNENTATLIQNGLSSHSGIHYIKLHGSYGWKSSDGSSQLVIGKNKEALIQKEPLLSGYFDLFQNYIREGGKKMLIIGYGFKDQHINQVLLDGVEKHGLEVYIVSTQSPAELRYQIEHGHYYAKNILDGLRGYFPYQLKEIFPGNQERTVHFNELLNALALQ